MPIEIAGGRDDGRVHADDLAVHVEQRTAGVALVDGGVGLQVVVVGTGVDVALLGGDDADRDRAAEPERIADRHDPVADLQPPDDAEGHLSQRPFRHRPSAAPGRSWCPCRCTFSTLSLEPSLKLTMISSAPSMTWLFVTIRPSLPSMTKPEPCAVTLRSDGRTAALAVEEVLEELLERCALRHLRQRCAFRALQRSGWWRY